MAAAAGPAAAGSPSGTTTTQAVAAGTRLVTYRGVRVAVPVSWPVIDLAARPSTCVRLDKPAVYLGAAGAGQSDCPAHAVGRANTIWLKPATTAPTDPAASRPGRAGALAAQVGDNPTGHDKHARFTTQNVQLEATWATDSSTVDRVLGSATASTVQPASAPAGSTSSALSAPNRPTIPTVAAAVQPAAAPSPVAASAVAAASSAFTGMAFDTCSAPPVSTMGSWLASPYRATGIYIGGSMRACGDGNLSASWVSQMRTMGWAMLPIYVGAQAPCVNQSGLAKITASAAATQGTAAATDAVARAQLFGLGSGTPIYYDMEQYNSAAAGCSAAVLKFVSAWTVELHRRGYQSGAYGSSSSLMVDLSKSVGAAGFTAPDNVWFAHWDQLQTASDAASYPAFSNSYWNHQRVHQYAGGATQKWAGVSVNVDANWVDAAVAGTATPVAYGANATGPGGRGFVFTGSMAYWRSTAPSGLRQMAYWTYANGATESNGATWSPALTPGAYKVSANVPSAGSSMIATYTIKDALGTTRKVINQASAKGYVSLGTFTAGTGSPITVHVGDNSTSASTLQLGVDAMAFQAAATLPGAPTSVSAAAGDAQAVIGWGAAPANASAVTGYTVTATPGGGTTTTTGALSATLSGLANGTSYTFTVTATNAVGRGPVSAASAAVTPKALAVIPAGPPSRTVFSPGDFTGDARPDIMRVTSTGDPYLYRGDGTGGFTSAGVKIGSGWTAFTKVFSTGDFTGDGKADVMAVNAGGDLYLYRGNGLGGWAGAGQKIGVGWNTFATVFSGGDFTGDGKADVLGVKAGGDLYLYRGNGLGGFASAGVKIGTGWTFTTVLSTGDFTGDGKADVLGVKAGGDLYLYRGNGAGGFASAGTKIGTGWNIFSKVFSGGDSSGDAKTDILGATPAGDLRLYRGNGLGGFAASGQKIGTGWT